MPTSVTLTTNNASTEYLLELGARGPIGATGPQGERGPGRYTFSISGADLLAHYDDDVPPSLTINSSGDLILDLN
jgi:hypothetical protein